MYNVLSQSTNLTTHSQNNEKFDQGGLSWRLGSFPIDVVFRLCCTAADTLIKRVLAAV